MKIYSTISLLCFVLHALPPLLAAQQTLVHGQQSANPLSPAEAVLMSSIDNWVGKANERLEQNDITGARQAAETALHLAGSQRRSLIADDLAPIYLRSGQYVRAASLFGQQNNPSRALSLNEAIALIKLHRFAEARKCYRESQLLYYHRVFRSYLPGTSNNKNFAATVFLWRGIVDVDAAHPVNGSWALSQAVQLVPRNPLALCYYGDALAATGRVQEAKGYYLMAIKLDHGVAAKRARAGLTKPH